MADFFEQIQDYLDGTLAADKQQAFEQRLEEDADLRRETDFQRELREILVKHLAADADIPALKATLAEAGKAYVVGSRPKKKNGIIRLLVPVAAAACLLLVCNYLGLFAPRFERLPDMPVSVTRDGDADAIYERAASAFNAGDYDTSTELLDRLIADDSTAARYAFYRGLAHLGQENYQEAVADLKPIADGASVFAEDACYFTAVALWRMDNRNGASAYAARVTPTSAYHKKATQLQRRLD